MELHPLTIPAQDSLRPFTPALKKETAVCEKCGKIEKQPQKDSFSTVGVKMMSNPTISQGTARKNQSFKSPFFL